MSKLKIRRASTDDNRTVRRQRGGAEQVLKVLNRYLPPDLQGELGQPPRWCPYTPAEARALIEAALEQARPELAALGIEVEVVARLNAPFEDRRR